jgi:hypothetical protein
VTRRGGYQGFQYVLYSRAEFFVKVFTYDAASVAAISATLSADRLLSYGTLATSSSDERTALDLYVWNAGFAGALFGPIQAVEVAFRNSIHREMSAIFGTPVWYSDYKFKTASPHLIGSLIEVAGRLTREKKPVDPPHMVAGLHFGFWTQLLKAGPDGNFTRKFWNAGLSEAFLHYPGGSRNHQGEIRGEIMRLKGFRNRVAHHEPLHNKRPEAEYERILRVSSWLEPALPRWIEHHSRCRKLLVTKPISSPGF